MRAVSATESPPNFSTTASASTSATIASATTPAAGTAQTSERWLIATAGSPVATSTVASARGHGGDRLHRGPHPQRLAGAHPALGAAGAPGAPAQPAGPLSISSCAWEPRPAGQVEPVAELDALDRLDAHQRAGQPGVQPAVAVHVAAEAGRQAVRDDLDDAAERVAVLAGRVDLGHHRLAGDRVEAAHRRRRRPRPGRPARAAVPYGTATSPMRDHVGQHGHAERLVQERLGHRAERDPGRGLPGAGPLQHRPRVVEAVLLHADQVGVPGPRPGQRRVAGQPVELSAGTGSAPITFSHFGHSVLPIRIATGPPSVRPCRTPPSRSTSSRSKLIRAPRP